MQDTRRTLRLALLRLNMTRHCASFSRVAVGSRNSLLGTVYTCRHNGANIQARYFLPISKQLDFQLQRHASRFLDALLNQLDKPPVIAGCRGLAQIDEEIGMPW